MYAALPFELHLRWLKAEAAGLEPATCGLKIMYSNRQSVMYVLATKLWSDVFSVRESNPPTAPRPPASLDEAMYSNRQSPCVFKKAQRSFAKRLRSRYGRPCQQAVLPTVDWPHRLRETPAPFTSRSPGIATLGPSCTPDRQLG